MSSARRSHRPKLPFRLLLSMAGLLLAMAGTARAETSEPYRDYLGSEACAACHADAARAWAGSHHDLAMQKPSAATVLGDFDNARFEHFDSITEFFRRDDRFIVRTEGADGERRDFEVVWVFGVYPLQQYLLPTDNGRLQALSVAWDSRPAAEGGQRWFHLYPDEPIPHDDPLHWTGPYQNWNARCAECHSTDFRKNFDASADRYSSVFFEEDVGCEACHGPGRRHAELMQAGREGEVAREGLGVDLAARGRWSFAADSDIARRESPLASQTQIDGCARCHARRGTLGAYRFDRPLSDTHRLALLGAPLYHHDGQILDEVYVYGSFVQSKMHRAGVVCSNCHEPHSNALRAPGNGVCAQCHRASVFDAETHHHHPAGSDGAQCVNCHMPARTYMGVDDRRDHSMRIPRPDLSVALGTPNACTACHDTERADWAVAALQDWGVPPPGDNQDPAAAMAAAERGDGTVAPRLAALAAKENEAAIWRATTLERAASLGSPEALRLAETLLASPDPLLRVSAVRALEALPLPERYARLAPLARDPVSGVRLEVAAQLAGVPLDRIGAAQREELLALFDEYRSVHREHADMPSMNLQLGLFHLARGDRPAAEGAYRRALEINPQLMAARLNFADLLRAGGREDEARSELTQALATNPDSADAMHALGLLEIRAGHRDTALDWLTKAATGDNARPRHRYVYAIAQHDTGDLEGALRTLQALHRDLPGDADTLLALVNYSVEAGDREAAQRYADRLVALAPGNSDYQRLRASLR